MQVFYLQWGDRPKDGTSDSAEHNRLIERIARAFCLALCPHLKLLKEDGMAKLGLRVTFESQEVRGKIQKTHHHCAICVFVLFICLC